MSFRCFTNWNNTELFRVSKFQQQRPQCRTLSWPTLENSKPTVAKGTERRSWVNLPHAQRKFLYGTPLFTPLYYWTKIVLNFLEQRRYRLQLQGFWSCSTGLQANSKRFSNDAYFSHSGAFPSWRWRKHTIPSFHSGENRLSYVPYLQIFVDSANPTIITGTDSHKKFPWLWVLTGLL